MSVERNDNRTWHQGPLFTYHQGKANITVDVVQSSWPIRGLAPAKAVLGALGEFKRSVTGGVLDFGAGSWLRYIGHIRTILKSADIHAVEFVEAFKGEAEKVRQQYEPNVSLWTPSEFHRKCKHTFDLIVAVNVLNTMPEIGHQKEVFALLSKRLNPLGKLVIYQRIWAESENPPGARAYGDGWIVPQPHHQYCTYRGKTGARWFNERAKEQGLKVVDIRTGITSSNTLLRVWERPFD